jgi:hypothetical protein
VTLTTFDLFFFAAFFIVVIGFSLWQLAGSIGRLAQTLPPKFWRGIYRPLPRSQH